MTDQELTAIYNEASGIDGGKNPPITTQRIFAAMRLATQKEKVAVLREAAVRCDALELVHELFRMADELEASLNVGETT